MLLTSILVGIVCFSLGWTLCVLWQCVINENNAISKEYKDEAAKTEKM